MTLLSEYEKKLWPIVEDRYEDQLGKWQRIYHKILKVIRPISYPLKRTIESWKVTRKYGSTVEKQACVTLFQQLIHQILLYVRYGLPPTSYYKYRLFNSNLRKMAKYFVHHKQMGVLMEGINIISEAEYDVSLLWDKAEFFRHCNQYNIPTPPVLLVFQGKSVIPYALSSREPLPQRGLFSKPVVGGQGHGTRCWSYVESEERYRDTEGKLLTEAELRATLKHHSRDRGVLLQPQIQNHSRLKTLGGEPLCAARMVTGRQPESQARHLISSFRLSADGGVASNFSAGGIGAPIDSSTGRLGMGHYKEKIGEGELERHPSTKEKIVDFQLPDWQDAVKLVERAHNTLSELHFVGWDVAFTESGPLILEGNTTFGAEVLQIPHRQPLELTGFSDYYSTCLEHYM